MKTIPYSWKNHLFFLFFIFTSIIFGQTTIINPATVGGFESGTTFASNGWTATTGSTNPLNHWVCNTGATAGFSGTSCAYITRTGTNHDYNVGNSRASHFYRNITIPAGETNITLSFNWMGQGESSFDKMRVWIVPTTVTPVYGTALTASGIAPTGNIQVGAANYSLQGSWVSTSFNLPTAYAGTTVRLVFEWTNDGSLGTTPPAAIDAISLTSQTPTAPANNECTTATTLTVNGTATCTTSTNGNTNFATQSQAGCSGTADDDVWYSFVATGVNHTITVTPTTLSDAVFQVFSGACGSLTSLACTNATSGTSNEVTTLTGLTIGATYRVRVYSNTNGSGQGSFSICITTPPPPPANDNCNTATSLTISVSCTYSTYTTVNATASTTPSTPPAPGCASYSGGDVWFSFVVPASGQVTVDTQTGGMSDSGMAWYTGTCGTLTLLECDDDDSANGLMSSITRTGLTPGATIYVRVWEYSNDNQGTFGICVTSPGPCTTPGAQASGFTTGTVTSNSFPATFSGTANSYLVIRSTSATPPSQPVNGVVYTGANIGTLGAGLTFVQDGTSTTILGTGLTGNTRYYYYIYAYNNTNCSGGPLYNVSGPLTGNAVTCPAAPSPVTTSSTLTTINFSWPSSLGGGINAVTYQLQVTTDAGFTAIIAGSPFTINDPTTTRNIAGLTSNTTYYYRIRANNGCWSAYTTGTATTGYCAPAPTSVDGTGITNVTMGTINNTTGVEAGNYGNYSAMSTSGTLGQTIPFSITFSTAGFSYETYIWVDWNNDLDFNDPGELVFTGTSPSATPSIITGNFQIPGSASIGNHRIRIGGADFGPPTPCYTGSYASYEDYTVNVTAPPACAGVPNAGTVTTAPTTGWPGSNYTVAATGYSIASNLTYQWQNSLNSGPWTNAGVATSFYTNYTATAPASGIIQWRLVVTCTTSSQSAISSIGTFTTLAVSSVGTGCPNVVSGGLGLNGADPATITCVSASGCVDLEATYLDLGNTTNYIVEPIAYTPPFSFTGLANPIVLGTDDYWSNQIVNLPFDFCFFGNTYNQVLPGPNGALTFDTSLVGAYAGYSFSNNLPSTASGLFNNTIYGVYHDINSTYGGQFGWELVTLSSGCRALVVAYNNVPMFSDNAILYSGMIVLYENSNIIEVYVKEKKIDNNNVSPWNDGNAIIGLQNDNGTLAVVPPGRNALDTNWEATGEAWRFVPDGTSIASLRWYEGSGTSGPMIGTSDVLNVCPTATTTYTAEITYTLCDGRTIKELDETTVTVNKDKIWNGSVDTNWNTGNNWTPIGVPTAAQSVSVPNVTNDPIIGAGADALACSLSIENGGVLTINSGRNMVVTNAVTVAAGGTFNVRNSANLVQINNASINSGNINMERVTNVRLQDYSYWSSPVNSFPVTSISPLTPSGFIFKWGTTTANANGGQGTWVNTTESMIPAKGYIVRAPNGFTNGSTSPLTANFIGTPNNGIFSPTIYRGTDFTGTGTQGIPRTITDDNWNLVGNPYPSSLGVNEFLTLPANNTIVGGVRIWTHGQLPTNAVDPFYEDFATNYYPNDYITINLTGATSGPGDYKIGAGQGFMVLMNAGAAGSSTVTFNNSMRNATFANTQFYRNSTPANATETIEQNRIWLDLVAPTGSVNRMLVGYVTDATQAEDFLYDSFTDYKPSQNFYSLIGNDPMAIQGRALPFDANDKVNLGVTIPQNGMYNIALTAIDGLFETTNQNIYIEDLDNNIIHDLRQNPYSFTATTGNFTNRFVLRYTNSTLGNEDVINEDANVWATVTDHLVIQSTKNEMKSVRVFDVLGRLLADYPAVNSYEVPLTRIQKNNVALLVQVTLSNGTVVHKKVIY